MKIMIMCINDDNDNENDDIMNNEINEISNNDINDVIIIINNSNVMKLILMM